MRRIQNFLLLGLVTISLCDVRLSGEIRGLQGKGPALIGIFNADTWGTKQPVRGIKVEPERFVNGVATFSVMIPPGEYGVTAIEDFNRNNRLDFNFIFPAEPAGFSRDFRPMGPPNFSDFKFRVDKDTLNINVVVR